MLCGPVQAEHIELFFPWQTASNHLRITFSEPSVQFHAGTLYTHRVVV